MRKLEMDHSLTLHLAHVVGARMIEQGTDGLSRGLLTEGVLAGKDMLLFIDISKTAVERQPDLVKYVESWTNDHLSWLLPEEWFNKGHGMWGGLPNADGIWIPTHAKNGRLYVWTPPSSVADVALEEALKATHKRTDAFHIFLIPRLCTTRWLRMFYKLCDFVFVLPVNSSHWPSTMHELLFVGVSLPLCRYCPWTLRGTPLLVDMERQLREVFVKVKEMDGIFCANFCESRGGFPACRSAWHAECYECLGMGKFPPMFCKEDVSGNAWCRQEDQEYILNHSVVGVHTSIPFQCEKCWMINLERRLPVPGRDDAYGSFIRRANLDAIAGRLPSTSQSHARDIVRMVRNCALIGKTPTIPPRGPMPLADPCGMGTAIDIILTSLTAKSRIKGQKFVQFGSARKIRGSFGAAWESSPQGIEEGSSFERGSGRGATFTSCPTQLKWFLCFVIGTETRMGHASIANKAISMNIILRMLEMVKEEMAQANPINRRALCKFGAAMVAGVTASLLAPWARNIQVGSSGYSSIHRLGKAWYNTIQSYEERQRSYQRSACLLRLPRKVQGRVGIRAAPSSHR